MDELDGVRWSRTDQEEVATFQPFVQGDDSSSSTNEDYQGSDTYAAPDHVLRIIGAVLFGLNLCATLYLQRLGSLRREQREREAARKEEELGGLATEEGLDRILDLGKRESMASCSMVAYDEENQELVASHGAAGEGSSTTSKLLLQDKACVVLPEAGLQSPRPNTH
jgi:hypothetical protein